MVEKILGVCALLVIFNLVPALLIRVHRNVSEGSKLLRIGVGVDILFSLLLMFIGPVIFMPLFGVLWGVYFILFISVFYACISISIYKGGRCALWWGLTLSFFRIFTVIGIVFSMVCIPIYIIELKKCR